MGATAHRATQSARPADVEPHWYVIDAEDVVLGRLATRVATILRGKHRPEYTPHVDTGDYIVVVNAEKVRVTGNKLKDKMYHQHTGYIGNLKTESLEDLLDKAPERVITQAVKGMLPKNRLSRQVIKKLKIYGGSEHPHAAQKPSPFPTV